MNFYHWRKFIIVILLFAFSVQGCRNAIQVIEHSYNDAILTDNRIQLVEQPDTLQFNLCENTYNEIKSFNTFEEKGIHYISFYDQRSQSINIHYLLDQRLYRRLPFNKYFNERKLHKTSVFMKNWDSIFIINEYTLRLIDSSGHKKQKIEFPTEPEGNAAVFDNHQQPVLDGTILYAISRNRVDYKSLNALRNWKVMYRFDLVKGSTQLLYPLPRLYQENLYGDRFLEYNFCYNDRGKFVFSFPADTLLYETDLAGYYHAYFARSREHQLPIAPVPEQALKKYEDGLKEYAMRDSYGPVFFDPFHKYYLRLSRHKLTPEAYEAKQHPRQTVLIFNEAFQIIGESDWPSGADFASLFFTPDRQLYARTNFSNEYALQFVRFAYQVNQDQPPPLAGANTPQK